MSDTIEMLRKVPMFAELDENELTWVADLASGFEVPAGFVLIEHGQPGSGMFIITEGTVVVELPQGPVELGPGSSSASCRCWRTGSRGSRGCARRPR